MSQPVDIRTACALGLRVWAALAALYVGLLLVSARGSLLFADGYDGVGFVLAVTDFDLSRFQPHPPGFPLLVLCSRLLHAVFAVSPSLSVALVSALLLPLGLGAVSMWLAVLHGRAAALWFALLAGPNILVWGLGVATLSDGAGLGLTLAALSAVAGALSTGSRRLAVVAGVLSGCALGVRPQSAALLALGLVSSVVYVGWLRRPWQRPLVIAAATSLFVGLAWLLPLMLTVGPQRFAALCLSHARGHFADFGGRVLGTPADARLASIQLFLRTLAAALGPVLLVGLALCGLWLARHRRTIEIGTYFSGVFFLVSATAYLALALLAVRVTGDGRHLGPVPVLVAAAMAPVLTTAARRRGLRVALLTVAVAAALLNARAVLAFRRSPAAGAQLATALPDCSVPVYGARAARYVDLRCGAGTAQPAVYLGEVLSDLARRSNPPQEVFVTSEVIASPASQHRLRSVGRFCLAADVPSILRIDSTPRPPKSTSLYVDTPGCVELFAYRVLP